MYRLICPCGQEIEIRGSQAGCQVTCDCGRTSRAPSLRELTANQELNKATPAIDLQQKVPGDDTKATNPASPKFQFFHCCGKVGRDGNVSNLAMHHYLELVQLEIWETIKSIENAPFAELVLSVAIAPDDKQRIEFDLYPKTATFVQQEELHKKIRRIVTPPVLGAPIAFAFYVRIHPVNDTQRLLSTFPSLTDSINALGIELAIRKAFDMTADVATSTSDETKPKRESWWRRLFFGSKLRQPTVPAKDSERELFLAQEE